MKKKIFAAFAMVCLLATPSCLLNTGDLCSALAVDLLFGEVFDICSLL